MDDYLLSILLCIVFSTTGLIGLLHFMLIGQYEDYSATNGYDPMGELY